MFLTISAGLLMYRLKKGCLEVLLAHPGGPYYAGKDDGYWGIPKGGMEVNESLMQTAIREFTEETGFSPTLQNLAFLGRVIDTDGKRVYAWAFAGDCDTSLTVNSNLFEMEWPEKSGIFQQFPEIDKLEFFSTQMARYKIEPRQAKFIDYLEKHINKRYRPYCIVSSANQFSQFTKKVPVSGLGRI